MEPVGILGIGTAQPPQIAEQSEIAEYVKDYGCRNEEEERILRVLYRRSGVKRRASVTIDPGPARHPSFFPLPSDEHDRGPGTAARMALYHERAPGLALAAVQRAIADAGIRASEIGQLVTVSCTGFGAPGFDIELVRSLGLVGIAGRTHIGFMGCHAALNGLRVATAMARADPSEVVLVCATELCSIHFQYGWDPDRIVANSLFADGAGAVILGNRRAPWSVAANRAWIAPDSEHAMTWSVGDHGFVMTLSAQVPELITKHLRPALEPWLTSCGVGLQEVKSWAVHPGGPRILSAVTEALALPSDALATSRQVLSECGNMSSPTLLFILDRLRRADVPRPCVALGFGPGLNTEAMLLV